jgi:hypothetical protein
MPLSAAPLRSWSPTTEIECIGLRDVFADPPDETLVLALNHHLFSPAAPSGGCCMRPSTPEGSAWKHDSVYESRSADRPALLPSAPNTALIVRRAAIAERKGDYVLQTADEAGRARKSCAVPCGDIQSSWFKYKAPADGFSSAIERSSHFGVHGIKLGSHVAQRHNHRPNRPQRGHLFLAQLPPPPASSSGKSTVRRQYEVDAQKSRWTRAEKGPHLSSPTGPPRPQHPSHIHTRVHLSSHFITFVADSDNGCAGPTESLIRGDPPRGLYFASMIELLITG